MLIAHALHGDNADIFEKFIKKSKCDERKSFVHWHSLILIYCRYYRSSDQRCFHWFFVFFDKCIIFATDI